MDWANLAPLLTSVAAVIAAIAGLLKLVTNALDRIERRHEKFLADHMEANVDAVKEVSLAMRQLHEDNTETARHLKHQDATFTRRVSDEGEREPGE